MRKRANTFWFGMLGCAFACTGASPTALQLPKEPSASVNVSAPAATHTQVGSDGQHSVAYIGLGDFSDEPKGSVLVYDFDGASGKLSFTQELKVGHLATFLAVAPNRRTLYMADEATHDLYCFRIDAQTGTLSQLCQAKSQGNPVYLALDPTGQTLLTTFYNQGKSETFALLGDGNIGPSADLESSGRRSHAIVLDRSSQFAFVPALEDDWIAQYRFDAATHQLTPNPDPTSFTLPGEAGLGPRHFAFTPTGEFGYLVNELALTVTTYRLDSNTGRLSRAIPAVSTLPKDATPAAGDAAADIHVHPNGRFLYASNRRGDASSLAVFSLDSITGTPTLLATESTRGRTPRNFKLSPDGSYLLVANQDSKSLVSFAVDANTGALTYVESVALPEKPYCVAFAALATEATP